MEKGSGLIADHSHTRPVDILVLEGRHAAFDVTNMTPPLSATIFPEASRSVRTAAALEA